MIIRCIYNKCLRYGTVDCGKCKNNKSRNKAEDMFEPCEDKEYLNLRAHNGRYKAERVGTPEQGGIRCPACGYSNNTYTFKEDTYYECEGCGLPMTLKE